MFEAKLANAGLLKKIVEPLKGSFGSLCFRCDEHQVTFDGYNSSHTAVVSAKITADQFTEYSCDRKVKWTIDVEKLANVMSTADSNDTCFLKYSEIDQDKLFINFVDSNTGYSTETITKLDEDMEPPQCNLPEFAVMCEMKSSELQKRIKKMSFFEKIEISASLEGFKVRGWDDFQEITTSLPPLNDANLNSSVTVEVRHPVREVFTLSLIHQFTKSAAISETVRLYIVESGICVEYPIEEDGYLRFYLAPNIDEDDGME